MFYVAGKIIVVRVWGNQTAIKSMLHTSAQHSAQLNNQYVIFTYCILIHAFYIGFKGIFNFMRFF